MVRHVPPAPVPRSSERSVRCEATTWATGTRGFSVRGDKVPLSGLKGFVVIVGAMFLLVGLVWALAAWAATQG